MIPASVSAMLRRSFQENFMLLLSRLLQPLVYQTRGVQALVPNTPLEVAVIANKPYSTRLLGVF